MLAAIRKHGGLEAEIRQATINGLPGLVRFYDRKAQPVLAIGVTDGSIAAVFVIRNAANRRKTTPLSGGSWGNVSLNRKSGGLPKYIMRSQIVAEGGGNRLPPKSAPSGQQ
jgi:hypothetical protein